jgi:hypothetical protein
MVVRSWDFKSSFAMASFTSWATRLRALMRALWPRQIL